MTDNQSRELYWYVLAAYLFAIGFGAAVFVAIVGLTNRVTLIGLGALVILVVLGLASFTTFPALYKDTQYLQESSEWNPRWWLYAGGGAATPILGYFSGGILFGPRINLFLSMLSWLGSVATMCVFYLYRRHRAAGVP
ncbi:hypothetical protein [Haladaptatus cibarius]|uniref:hypothetical protein n=1 Tax=Haladaptatus cibarius TaxID=453847 RepID=UPI0006789F66|nr:hypothetical protein [Haladaptatus cibarius]